MGKNCLFFPSPSSLFSPPCMPSGFTLFLTSLDAAAEDATTTLLAAAAEDVAVGASWANVKQVRNFFKK